MNDSIHCNDGCDLSPEEWPARNGHKAGCCGYYELSKCECQLPNWKPLSARNYPSEPNPEMREPEYRDRE